MASRSRSVLSFEISRRNLAVGRRLELRTRRIAIARLDSRNDRAFADCHRPSRASLAPPQPPDAPDRPSIIGAGQRAAIVTWKAPPAYNDEIIAYKIRWRVGLREAFGNESTVDGSTFKRLVDKLTPGTNYQVREGLRERAAERSVAVAVAAAVARRWPPAPPSPRRRRSPSPPSSSRARRQCGVCAQEEHRASAASPLKGSGVFGSSTRGVQGVVMMMNYSYAPPPC